MQIFVFVIENIALNKPVHVTNGSEIQDINQAVDGIIDQQLERHETSAFVRGLEAAGMEIDLGGLYAINDVVVHNANTEEQFMLCKC